MFVSRNREHVAVGVAEPRDQVTAWGMPNVQVVLFESFVSVEGDARASQLRDERHDVTGRPTGNGERLGAQVRHERETHRRSVRLDHEGELVLVDTCQSDGVDEQSRATAKSETGMKPT